MVTRIYGLPDMKDGMTIINRETKYFIASVMLNSPTGGYHSIAWIRYWRKKFIVCVNIRSERISRLLFLKGIKKWCIDYDGDFCYLLDWNKLRMFLKLIKLMDKNIDIYECKYQWFLREIRALGFETKWDSPKP